MGEELLIDFNDSLKIQSSGRLKVEASLDAGNYEVKCLSELSSFLGGTTSSKSQVTSNIQEKCILDKEYDELIPQLSSPMQDNLQCSNAENSDLIGLSPFGSLKVNRTNTLVADIVELNPTNLMSPFGCPKKIVSKNVLPEFNVQNSVPIGELLPVQDDSKYSIADDVFDVEVLEKKFDTKHSSESNNDFDVDCKSKLAIPSIPSICSSESQYSSFGVINKVEEKSIAEQVNLSRSPNEAVFEEAQAIAEELMKLAVCEANMPTEGIEFETSSIVSNGSDLDDIEFSDMKLIGNELDELLDMYAIENNDDLIEEDSFRKIWTTTPKMQEFKSSSEPVPMDGARTSSSSSSLSISPLPLSMERLNQIKLKASEPVGSSLKLASLKENKLTCSTVKAGRSGPLKALVPLSQIVKNTLSPIGVVSAKPRSMNMAETSPDFIKPLKTSVGVISSTPVLNKPRNQTKQIPSINKGFNGNIRRTSNQKLSHESSFTPSGQRSSNYGQTQEVGKHSRISRPVTTGVARKASIPSPSPGKRYSNSTPKVKTPVARSSSTGHLPLTPSLKKVNCAANTLAYPSPLRRSNSLSAKLSAGSPSHTLKTSVNSPAKGGTPLDKLISKFRRVSMSRGMKENVSPGKY